MTVKAVDAGRQRRFRKVRIKVIRFLIIALTIICGVLGYRRYEQMVLWRAFNNLTESFVNAHNSGTPGDFYDHFADPALKQNQSRDQYNSIHFRIEQQLGKLESLKLLEYRAPNPEKPFLILVYGMTHAGGKGKLFLALRLENTVWSLYAWKIEARALTK